MTSTPRAATPDDLDAVVDVLIGCWRETIASVAPASAVAAVTPELVRPLWEASARGHDGARALVTEDDSGEITGITRFQCADDGTGIVHSLYVSPRAQRRGVGARLLAAATQGLRELGADRLTLWALASNTPSLAFYRAQGWTPDGQTRVQPEFGVDELRLEYTGGAGTRTDDGGDGTAKRHPDRAAASAVAGHDVRAAAVGHDILAATARELVASGPNAPAGVAIGLRTKGRDLTAVAGRRGPGPDAPPLTLDTAHDLASVTKVLATTTALIRLVSSRDVHLDAAVGHYLPGFTGDGKDTVTVRTLLRHRGGLWEWQPLYLHDRTGTDAVEYAERLPLRYAPDTARHYSDLGFILLGRIVETVVGTGLDTAIRRWVTEPLDLTNTRYLRPVGGDVATSALDQAIERRMVATGDPYPVLDGDTGFDGWRSGPIVGEVNDGNAFHAFGGVSGHAGLFSTVGDLLTYATALADYRDHDELWDPAVVETFLAEGPDPEQVLGFRRYDITVDGRATPMYGHPGFVGCVVGFAPEVGLALALCSNRLLTAAYRESPDAAAPVPNDDLWARARAAATNALTRAPIDDEKPRGRA